MDHRRERGDVLLSLVMLGGAAVLAAALLAQLALAAGLRVTVQTAADAAALAAAHQLAEAVSGSDAAVWDCAGAPADALRRAATSVAAANGARLERLRRTGCEVEVQVRATLPAVGRDAAARSGGSGVGARARARLSPGARPGAGPRAPVRVPGAPLRRGTLLEAMIAEADRIDRLRLPYVWGGGHQSSPAPADGPFDCSGAVSRLLQAVGYPLPTIVSGDFLRVGAPGPGRVTIWAYDGHVFLTIDGRGWGTGSPPRGGAGWLPYANPYHSRFVARHLPELEDDAVVDLSELDLGTVLLGSPGGPPRIGLAPLGG